MLYFKQNDPKDIHWFVMRIYVPFWQNHKFCTPVHVLQEQTEQKQEGIHMGLLDAVQELPPPHSEAGLDVSCPGTFTTSSSSEHTPQSQALHLAP